MKNSGELVKAIDNAKPGDSIFVPGGNYVVNERIYINDSGETDNKIYLIGATLDFSSMIENSSHQGIVLKADNWHIKGSVNVY